MLALRQHKYSGLLCLLLYMLAYLTQAYLISSLYNGCGTHENNIHQYYNCCKKSKQTSVGKNL